MSAEDEKTMKDAGAETSTKVLHDTPASKTDRAHGARHANVLNLRLRPFICVTPATSVREAVERMAKEETDAIFVCDGGVPIGVVAYKDLLAREGSGGTTLDQAATVADFMRREVQSLGSDKTLGDVVQTMRESGRGYVAITKNANGEQQFIGAISDLDIVTYLAESYPKEAMNLPPVAAQAMDTREGG